MNFVAKGPTMTHSEQLPSSPAEAGALLGRLSALLDEERSALLALDHERVQALADAKAELGDALRALGPALQAADAAEIERLRGAARRNQLLLVHARDCVRQALGVLTGEASPTYGSDSVRAPAEGVRLNLRG